MLSLDWHKSTAAFTGILWNMSREKMDLEELDLTMRRHRNDFLSKNCDARIMTSFLSRGNHIGVEFTEFTSRGGGEAVCVVKKILGVDGGWKMMVIQKPIPVDHQLEVNRATGLSAG